MYYPEGLVADSVRIRRLYYHFSTGKATRALRARLKYTWRVSGAPLHFITLIFKLSTEPTSTKIHERGAENGPHSCKGRHPCGATSLTIRFCSGATITISILILGLAGQAKQARLDGADHLLCTGTLQTETKPARSHTTHSGVESRVA